MTYSTFTLPRSRLIVAASSVLGLAALGAIYRPDRAILAGSGLVSQTLCSATFVSGLDAHQVYAETVRPMSGMRWIDWAIRYRVDPVRREVITTVAGFFRSRAVHRDGLGCVLVHGAMPPASGIGPRLAVAPDAGLAIVHPSNEDLRAVLDRLFARQDLGTKAVVIMHDGRIIAERYAPGYGPNTPLRGWSVAKSVINALIGILVREGRLHVDRPAPVPAWSKPDDRRRLITIDHLLRMASGLAIEETGSGFDAVSRMLMVERDMAGFAQQAHLQVPPGSRWRYTSGNTVILSRIIRDTVGGQAEDVVRFARRELFDPLALKSVTIEFDATGTPSGSVYASARDWARFGQLYLDDGVAGGRSIFPPHWVSYSTRPTLDSGYGAGFWLAGARSDWHLPRGAFYASGHLHQKVLIVPSHRLVIARFGVTHAADDGFGYLAEKTVAALKNEQRDALALH